MAGVFFGFGLADTIVIKAMGVGMGLAVVLDATIVRALLVPATMRLLGRGTGGRPPSSCACTAVPRRRRVADPGRGSGTRQDVVMVVGGDR